MDSEIGMLLRFLNKHRRGVLETVAGLSDESLRRPVLPSGWTCLGMFQHLTVNERYWLRWAVGGEQLPGTTIVDDRCQVILDGMADVDDDWLVAPELTAATVLDRYRDETASADRILVDVALDDPPRNVDPQWNLWYGSGGPDTARWIILHMIEETAQHAGHLDVVRELLDHRPSAADQQSG
jgi:uncharacterized damage-inducible protein DinB